MPLQLHQAVWFSEDLRLEFYFVVRSYLVKLCVRIWAVTLCNFRRKQMWEDATCSQCTLLVFAKVQRSATQRLSHLQMQLTLRAYLLFHILDRGVVEWFSALEATELTSWLQMQSSKAVQWDRLTTCEDVLFCYASRLPGRVQWTTPGQWTMFEDDINDSRWLIDTCEARYHQRDWNVQDKVL